ncbi:MAG: hypothetical protein HY033_09380 [Ignavibacteriae bacterium]|nr:hypothetical protein [Ignavibacteriota bacterium]
MLYPVELWAREKIMGMNDHLPKRIPSLEVYEKPLAFTRCLRKSGGGSGGLSHAVVHVTDRTKGVEIIQPARGNSRRVVDLPVVGDKLVRASVIARVMKA